MLQAKQNVSDRALLTQQLRRYSADHVKITKEDTDQAKRLVDNYIKKEILPFICSESSLPISKQEYTGSLYEKLKTEAADEVDVMVILQTTKQEVTQEDAGAPGFVLLKASQDSQLQKYANAAGYILPEKLRASWFFGLVQKAVNQLQEKDPALPVKLEVRAHGPAVQLDITDKETEKKLSADLVPSFQLSATEYFVAKSYTGKISPACDPKLLWRQSFSLREKARLQDMDKEDQGCRHELLRIIKTLIRAESTFAKLTSYHLKTVFLHYNSNPKLMWGSDMLGERFLEYMEMLHRALAKKTLDHFWVEGVNLLDNIQDKTLENMADRLRKILDNDKERSKVLKCEMQLDGNGRKTKEKCPAITSGNQKQILPNTCQTSTDLLQLLRKFLDQLGTTLSDEVKWSKEVIEEYMKNGVLKYCQDNSPIISKFDYGGSLYENLKITGPDEEDVLIHVILKAKKNFVTFNVDNPGCATIKAVEGSPYKEHSREDGLLMPKKFKSWVFKLVNSAVQELSSKEAASMSLKASSCSTGVKVLIIGQTKTLEVKLVPTFPLISSDEYFVPPSQQGSLPAGTDSETAWVKSYTLMQKSLLKDMDKDQGCRHDLFKITNMVLRREPTFSPLSSFHVKTALLWYNQTTTEWKKEQLAERFTGFVGFLRDALQRKALKQFWITDLNLLEDISAVTLGNMESRLTKILNSEQERSKVLKAEKQEGKTQDGKNVASGTHTRSEMSPDKFTGEHPEKPSNQGYPGFPGGYLIALQQDPLYGDFFDVVGADQQIDANKLQGYLSTSGFFGSYHLLSLETCRLMITMLNRHFSGKVGVDEFRVLLILLRQWQGTFMECGHDESGTLGPCELQAALSSFGYGLSRKTFNNILERYSSNYRISFDNFVACCLRLKSVTDYPNYNSDDEERDCGSIKLKGLSGNPRPQQQETNKDISKEPSTSSGPVDSRGDLGSGVSGCSSFLSKEVTSLHPESCSKAEVPLDIQARGPLATEVYNRELKEGQGYARRVPIMIIGQSRTGKTSLKKSLKGELFDPYEGSTEGIETDPSYFKFTTDIWRTGRNSEDTETEPDFLLDRQLAQKLFKGLKEKELLGDPSTSGTKPPVNVFQVVEPSEAKPSVKDFQVVEPSEANSSPTESSQESRSNRFEPSLQDSKAVENAKARSLLTEVSVKSEELKTSSSVTAQIESDPSPQDSKDHQKVPENVAAWVEKLLKENKEFMEGDDMYSVIWDFGGQSVFYDTHPIFLTEKAIYILTCDLSCDPESKADTPVKEGRYCEEIRDEFCEKTNFDYLDFWMSSIYSLVSNNTNRRETLPSETLPAVFLACTHADKPYTKKGNPSQKIFGALKKIYGSLLKGVFVVDNTKSGSNDECEDVIKLREAVLSVAAKLPQMKEEIPLKWLRYEKVLYLMRKEGREKISIEEARKIASEKCGIDGDENFRTALNFLHDQKVLINFDESPGLERMVILNPQWLVDVFKEVITFKGFNHNDENFEGLWCEFEESGILKRELLDHVWKRFIDDQNTCESLIEMMEKFSLLCQWPSEGNTERYLVPSMLKSKPTSKFPNPGVETPSLFVKFKSRRGPPGGVPQGREPPGRVPPGLFSRLLLFFHHWVQDQVKIKHKKRNQPKPCSNYAMFRIVPEDDISAALMCYSSLIEIVFVLEGDFLDERRLNISHGIHQQLLLILEGMRKEFSWLKHMDYELCVACTVCCGQKGSSSCGPHENRGCDCLHLFSEKELKDPVCTRENARASCRVAKEKFHLWFSSQERSAVGGDNTGKRSLFYSEETASKDSATDPPEIIALQIGKKDLPAKSKRFDDSQIQVDILLLTVMKAGTCEDCEFLSCVAHLNPGYCKIFHPHLGYVYLGDMGESDLKLNVAVMKCYEGSSSTGGSIVVVINAVKNLKPKAVFCVGSCSGLNVTKVSLGDVVVLKKLVTYAFSKVTENGIEELGVKVPLKPHLSKLILNAGEGWKPPLKDPGTLEVKIHRGTFLSGPEVINNHKRCNELIERFPEAVAIEREGEGLFAAAHDLDIEWVVIKGISGYADGRKVKDSWRTFASFMAASLTAHILSDTIAFQALPHYGNASGLTYDALRLTGVLEAYRNAEKTEPSLNLKRVAFERGFVISDNQGGGNCMFFAISEQLKLIKGMKFSDKELRKNVVRYLKDNPTLPDGTDLFQFVEGYSCWDAYLRSMMTDGTWGDHVILHGAANCFNTCIHVISCLPHRRDVIINPQREASGRERLVLGHLHEHHYVSLIPSNLANGRWFDETNIKIVFAGLVALIAVVLFFCFCSN